MTHRDALKQLRDVTDAASDLEYVGTQLTDTSETSAFKTTLKCADRLQRALETYTAEVKRLLGARLAAH